jgi:hypothetical protein
MRNSPPPVSSSSGIQHGRNIALYRFRDAKIDWKH